jgi:hypothetical protein
MLRRAADEYEKAMTKSYSPYMLSLDSDIASMGDGTAGSYLNLISVSACPICLQS